MNDETSHPENQPDGEDGGSQGPQSQEVRHSQISARVPEHVAGGIFSTGAVVLQGGHEFVIDFLLRMTSPQQVAARVVMPPAVVARLINALRENLKNYENRFGEPPSAPTPPNVDQQQQPSAQELYEQLKISDEVLAGTYANAVMIGHSATEFSFDFITTFFPRSVVSCRVYLAAPNAQRFLDSLTHSFEQFQQKRAEQQQHKQDQPKDHSDNRPDSSSPDDSQNPPQPPAE